MKCARLPEWCLRLGIVYLICGMGFGMYMGSTDDFSLKDVHAHFNLLGYVSTFLIGLYLKAYPAALNSKFTVSSVFFVLGSVPLLLIILAAFYLGHPELGGALGAISGVVMIAYITFAISLFRTTARQ